MLSKSVSEYNTSKGWSSKLFHENAIKLFSDLINSGITVDIGRTVIHLSNAQVKIKAYVHYNGRSKEYATITDEKGNELETFHYTQFIELQDFIKRELSI